MTAEVRDHPVVSLLPSQSTDVAPSLKGSQSHCAKPAMAPVSLLSPPPAVPADLDVARVLTAEEEASVARALNVNVEMNAVTPPPPSPSVPRTSPLVPAPSMAPSAPAPSSLPFVALLRPPSADGGASVLEDPKVLLEPEWQNYLALSSRIRELEAAHLVLGWEIEDLRRCHRELVEPYTVTVPSQNKGKGCADSATLAEMGLHNRQDTTPV
ncbi:hypothetical protein BD413DRAFT_617729 [Trametes elegans]|nr:hypothetical protein BD413DRAFT_617729 [Trametes elegans]